MSNNKKLSDLENDPSFLYHQAEATMEACILELNVLLEASLKLFGIEKDSYIKFNREWFRLDMPVGDYEYHTGVSGKGSRKEDYYPVILKVIECELSGNRPVGYL